MRTIKYALAVLATLVVCGISLNLVAGIHNLFACVRIKMHFSFPPQML